MPPQITKEQAVRIQQHYQQNSAFFFKNFLGVEPWAKQQEIADSIVNNRVTTVRSCHAAGKSFTASCIATWFLMAHPGSIVVSTAPTWRQVKDILWREIGTRYAKAKVPLGGNEPTVTGWEISKNWYAVGLSTKDPDKFQGYHADSGYLLVICDEAAGMEEPLFEAIDAVLTSTRCRLLMIGNPTSSGGTFRESHKPSYPANKIKISAFDTPNFTMNNIANEEQLVEAVESKRPLIEAAHYLVSPIWVYERVKKWGKNSPMYQSRVSAEFPDQGENTLIPLSWIEAATTDRRLAKVLGVHLKSASQDASPTTIAKIENENELILKEALDEYKRTQKKKIGVDVARFGSDRTIIQPRFNKVVPIAESHHKEDTMQTAGRVWSQLANEPTEQVNVDVIGVGSGVVDRLMELQAEQTALNNHQWSIIVGVNVAQKAEEKPKEKQMQYANKRAELYWRLREAFESGDIYLEPNIDGQPDEDLMDELSSIQYKYVGDKIYIEEKSEMKKRLLKSPDRADALMLSYEKDGYSTWSDIPEAPAESEYAQAPITAGLLDKSF